jgi:retron-type reverse transcriptase
LAESEFGKVMIRVGGLWDKLISFENLQEAAWRAARGKRDRPDVAAFLLEQETELVGLRRELDSGRYLPGPYRQFRVSDPKPRLISAAPFRDRVVHHALTQVLEPVFERRFSKDSFACRKGFGTHRALGRAREAAAGFPYVLKCDIRKYFPSIDHAILKGLLLRAIKCRRTLALADAIIDGSNPQEELFHYFPGDDLFTPHQRRRGLPLGNQTSQFFGNVYLNPLDQMVNREIRAGSYIRYVDDFLLFAGAREELVRMKCLIEDCLAGLRVSVHERKSRVYRCSEGFTFLGWRIFPGHTRLVRQSVVRFRRLMSDMQTAFREGKIGRDEVRPRVQAWIGHAQHGNTWRLREQLFGQFAFVRGSGV